MASDKDSETNGKDRTGFTIASSIVSMVGSTAVEQFAFTDWLQEKFPERYEMYSKLIAAGVFIGPGAGILYYANKSRTMPTATALGGSLIIGGLVPVIGLVTDSLKKREGGGDGLG